MIWDVVQAEGIDLGTDVVVSLRVQIHITLASISFNRWLL
jgi:hypothetical protein